VAALLGLAPENVRVIYARGSGCYGINGADTVSYDAALLSQAAGRPVRVQLSRRDEMAWENYGFAYVIDQRVGLDTDGGIIAWDYEAWNPTLGGRPGYDRPGNVITGMLAGFEPAPFTARSPAPDPSGAFNNGSNAAPSYVTGCVGNACGGMGSVRSQRVLSHTVRSPFFTGPREGGSGGLSPPPPRASAPERGRPRGLESGAMGSASVAAFRLSTGGCVRRTGLRLRRLRR
jgi:hypothetical protein